MSRYYIYHITEDIEGYELNHVVIARNSFEAKRVSLVDDYVSLEKIGLAYSDTHKLVAGESL